MAAIHSKVQRAAKFDKINVSDEVKQRSPLAKRAYSDSIKAAQKILRSDEQPAWETDTNTPAELMMQVLKFISVDKNPSANLISVEIIAGDEASVELIEKHIKITIEDGVSTALDIKLLLEDNSQIMALVSVELDGADEAEILVAESSKQLSGAV